MQRLVLSLAIFSLSYAENVLPEEQCNNEDDVCLLQLRSVADSSLEEHAAKNADSSLQGEVTDKPKNKKDKKNKKEKKDKKERKKKKKNKKDKRDKKDKKDKKNKKDTKGGDEYDIPPPPPPVIR